MPGPESAIGVAQGPQRFALPHSEGPWGPRRAFTLALTLGADSVRCQRLLAAVLRAREAVTQPGDTVSLLELEEGAAVVWGDAGGVQWMAAGRVWVAAVAESETRVLHDGGADGAGRITLRDGETLVVASLQLVEGLGADHVRGEIRAGPLDGQVRRVIEHAGQQGLPGPHALLACTPSGRSGSPVTVVDHQPGAGPHGRWYTALMWGAVGVLCVVAVAFLAPWVGRLKQSADEGPPPAEAPETVQIAPREVWQVPETYPAGEEIWRFRAGKAITSSPLCVEGKIYVGSRDGRLYCLSARDGREVWRFEAGAGIGSSPCAWGPFVYVGCYDGRLYAVQRADGHEAWSAPTGGRVRASPVASQGLVFFGSEDSCFYGVDAESGRTRWKWKTGGTIWAKAAVASGQVLVGSTDGMLHCYDAQSGAPVWEYQAEGKVYGGALVAGGAVYFGSTDGIFYCLGLQDGSLRWSVPIAGGVHGTPCLDEGAVAVGSLSGTLYGLDPETGELLWEFRTGGELRSSPLALRGTFYLGSYDTYFYAVEARSGNPVWRFCVGSPIYSSPCSDTSMIYVGSNGATFVAMGTGEPSGR